MNFGAYITPEQAKAQGDSRSLEALRKMARSNRKCECGQPAWRYGGAGLCFPCTTGEADASEDCELISETDVPNQGNG